MPPREGDVMAEFQTAMCPACAAGLFEECENPKLVRDTPGWVIPCAFEFVSYQGAIDTSQRPAGRPVSSPEDVTDPTSTGRKRAAMMAPILTGQRCAWAGLKHAGGGVVPILGCNGHLLIEKKGGDEEQGFLQGDRHHGPDKNTLNNSVGMNLHSICVVCHHRWHSVNDPYYDEQGRPGAAQPFLPVEAYYLHDSVSLFTDEEFLVAETWWEQAVKTRGSYPFTPDESSRKLLPVGEITATLSSGDNPFPDFPFSEIGDSA